MRNVFHITTMTSIIAIFGVNVNDKMCKHYIIVLNSFDRVTTLLRPSTETTRNFHHTILWISSAHLSLTRFGYYLWLVYMQICVVVTACHTIYDLFTRRNFWIPFMHKFDKVGKRSRDTKLIWFRNIQIKW